MDVWMWWVSQGKLPELHDERSSVVAMQDTVGDGKDWRSFS